MRIAFCVAASASRFLEPLRKESRKKQGTSFRSIDSFSPSSLERCSRRKSSKSRPDLSVTCSLEGLHCDLSKLSNSIFLLKIHFFPLQSSRTGKLLIRIRDHMSRLARKSSAWPRSWPPRFSLRKTTRGSRPVPILQELEPSFPDLRSAPTIT